MDDPVIQTDSAENCGPVTVSISRKIIAGRESAYEQWVRGITAQALTFPGHMGVNVLRPSPGSREYVTKFRFDNYDHMTAWEESPLRAEWLHKLEDIVESQAEAIRGTGLEFWFSLPELPARHPSPHKMAIVLLVVVFSMLSILNFVFAPVVEGWPAELRLLFLVTVQVILMTYLIMPRVTKFLQGWLYS